jgi:hypothetical protein
VEKIRYGGTVVLGGRTATGVPGGVVRTRVVLPLRGSSWGREVRSV